MTRGTRVEELVMVRESSRYGYDLMEGMLIQTLDLYPTLPGRAELLAAGMEPMRRPDAFEAQSWRMGKSQAVLFEMGGTFALYSMGTAGTADLGDDNAFCTILVEVVRALRPRNLRLANFSRLVRSPVFSGELLQACIQHVDVVHQNWGPIEPATAAGQQLWMAQTMQSAGERTAFITRAQNGRVLKVQADRWPFHLAPFGYRLVDERLVVDASQVEAVRVFWQMIAAGETAARIVARMAAMGVASNGQRELNRRTGREANVGDFRNPASWVRGVYLFGDGYRTGLHAFTYQVGALPGVKAVLSIPVEDQDGKRVIRLKTPMPLPEGGWASPEVWAAVESEMQARMEWGLARVGTSRKKRPFAGAVRGERDGFEYALLSGSFAGPYRWLRRPVRPGFAATTVQHGSRLLTGWGAGPHANEEETLAVIEPAVFHRSFAEKVAEAIRDGVPAQLLDGGDAYRRLLGSITAPPLSANELRRDAQARLRSAERRLMRAQDLLVETTERELQAGLRRSAEEYAREVGLARQALKEVGARKVRAVAPDVVLCEADMVVRVLAELADLPAAADRELGMRLADVVDGLWFEADRFFVYWSTYVLLPARGDVLRLGPIHGRLRQYGKGLMLSYDMDAQCDAAAYYLIYCGMQPVELLGPRNGQYAEARLRAWAVDSLKRAGLVRRDAFRLLDEGDAALRQRKWRALYGPPPRADQPWGARRKRRDAVGQ